MAVAAELQPVFAVPEDIDFRLREKAAKFIGAVAAGAWEAPKKGRENLNIPDAEDALLLKPIESLYDAIQEAAEGNENAHNMVEINVFTDVIERTIKSGHVTLIQMEADAAGNIQQFGQTLESVQANSLRFASGSQQMGRRVEAETRNAFRLKHFYEQGLLEDYYFVAISRAADDMSQAEMERAGFFTDTMSCSIQATSAEGNTLVMESGFVAGRAKPGVERHDESTVETMGKMIGVNLEGKSATELLDTPILIHKSLMPNGVIDLVRVYDKAAGNTFFGEAKPSQDYSEYRQKCAEREVSYKPTVAKIVAELIAEADTITDRVSATRRLNKISGRHMIEQAVTDTSIDPVVFGRQAALHIEKARQYFTDSVGSADDRYLQGMFAELSAAYKVDQSSSCPNGADYESKTSSESIALSSNEPTGDCEFVSKECPLCGQKNVKTTVRRKGAVKTISGGCGCSTTSKAD